MEDPVPEPTLEIPPLGNLSLLPRASLLGAADRKSFVARLLPVEYTRLRGERERDPEHLHSWTDELARSAQDHIPVDLSRSAE